MEVRGADPRHVQWSQRDPADEKQMRGKEDYPCRTEADGGFGAARAMALHAPQDADGGTIGSA
ncbi:hypothetical protein GCM10009646_30670 [Streptomyces aureus]